MRKFCLGFGKLVSGFSALVAVILIPISLKHGEMWQTISLPLSFLYSLGMFWVFDAVIQLRNDQRAESFRWRTPPPQHRDLQPPGP